MSSPAGLGSLDPNVLPLDAIELQEESSSSKIIGGKDEWRFGSSVSGSKWVTRRKYKVGDIVWNPTDELLYYAKVDNSSVQPNFEDATASNTWQLFSAAIPRAVEVACVVRNNAGTWALINDTDHEPYNVDSIETISAGGFKVNYTFTAKQVISLTATPDETYAELGWVAGGSVGTSYSGIVVCGEHTALSPDTNMAFWFRRSSGVYGYVYYTGSAWTSSDSAGISSYSFDTSTGYLTVNHSAAGLTEMSIVPRYSPAYYRAEFVSYGSTITRVLFRKTGIVPNAQSAISGANVWVRGTFFV